MEDRYLQPQVQHKEAGSIKEIIKLMLPYKLILMIAILGLFATSTAVLFIGYVISYIIDNGLVSNNPRMLDHGLLWLLIIVLVLALSTGVRYCCITIIGERVAIDIRRAIYNHALKLSQEFYESHKIGDILSKLTSDVTELQTLIGSSISVAARNVVMLIGGLITMSLTNLKLFCILFIVLPLVVLPIVLVGRIVRKYSKVTQEKVSELVSKAEETISSMRIVQAYCHEAKSAEEFDNKLKDVLISAFTRIKFRALVVFIVITMVFGGVAFVMWIGGHDVLEGSLTSGQLSSFLFLGIVCAGALGALSEASGDFQKAIAAIERIKGFLKVDNMIPDKGDGVAIERVQTGIVFNDVGFYYKSKPEHMVLNKLQLEVGANMVTAIVGESGSGKSTIMSLLLRFYDVNSGSISIDGVDIRNIKLANLRGLFSYVPQETMLFSGTVYENVVYGFEGCSEAEVLKALDNAMAMEFVNGLEHGMHTYIGEKGVRLSGGQRQRIAIARAFIKNPQVLLLDEATSALDSINEKAVQSAIERLMRGRTVIVVAHRLSTIVKANKIVFLKAGQVAESGPHNELMKLNGFYKALFDSYENITIHDNEG